MSYELKSRLKSFAWRGGCYAVVALLDFAGKNLGDFQLPPVVVTLIALVLGETTKWINNNTNLFGTRLK